MSALEIWNILKNLYEDRGLSRETSLIRAFVSIRLEDCENMGEYIGKLKEAANKLVGIGFTVEDKWLSGITLSGLTEEFRPVIYSLETNSERPTSDFIMTKLLDLQPSSSSASSAFFNKNKKKKFKKQKKCYNCGSASHLSNACDKEKKSDKKDTDKKDDDSKKKPAFVALLCKEKENDDEWHIDSGTGRHMRTSDIGMYETKRSDIIDIVSANNGVMKVKKCGKVKIEMKNAVIEADDVLHVPDIAVNLLSVYQICKKGNEVSFKKNMCYIKNADGELITSCKAENGVYKIGKKSECCFYTDKKAETNALTWHRRLGHMNLNTMNKMRAKITGINYTCGERLVKNCEICARAKNCRLPFKTSETKSNDILELIHSDIMGPRLLRFHITNIASHSSTTILAKCSYDF